MHQSSDRGARTLAVRLVIGETSDLRNPRNNRLAEGDIICRIAKRKDTWEWKEVECLGMTILSLTNMLRIGEAWTMSSPGDGKLCFMGEKSR